MVDSAPSATRFDIAAFASVVRRVIRPVIVMTVAVGDEHRGMTAASFNPLSWRDGIVSVNLANYARTLALVEAASHFVVNVLGHDQRAVAERLSRPDLLGEEQFKDLAIRRADCGALLLEGTLGALECEKLSLVAVGDHTLLIGRTVAVHPAETGGWPLLAGDGGYFAVGESLGSVDFVAHT